MLTGFDVVLGMTLWLARQREPVGAEASGAPAVAIVRARRSTPAFSACDPAVDDVLAAWEKATIENPRKGCSFRRFRYDYQWEIEYRAEGEINVYQKGSWDYRAEPTNVPPIALPRKPVPRKTPFELRADSAERLLVLRESVKIRVTTENGTEERSFPTFCNLFDWSLPDWLLPFISKEPAQPRLARPDDSRPIDISGLPFAHVGVTPSAAIVPTFLAAMRREDLLKRFEVSVVESRGPDQVRLRFNPRTLMTAEVYGEVQIILNRDGYVPEALLLTNLDGNSEIVHVFRDWTFEKPAK